MFTIIKFCLKFLFFIHQYFHIRALGMDGAEPDRIAVFIGSSHSYKPGGRLPLLSARPISSRRTSPPFGRQYQILLIGDRSAYM